MKSSRLTLIVTAACALTCSVNTLPGFQVYAQSKAFQSAPVQSTPDNSRNNKGQAPTADNQPDAKADRMTTASVRKAIMADKSLSTYAHNVKIITMNGAVTLKGPVKSEEEKQKVAADAASAVSPDKVTNELTVKSQKTVR